MLDFVINLLTIMYNECNCNKIFAKYLYSITSNFILSLKGITLYNVNEKLSVYEINSNVLD